MCWGLGEGKKLCEVRQQLFYAISADEATDCSNKEQMPFVVRFVDQDNNIREEFDFILCDEGTTGHAIATKLIEELNMCRLPLSNNALMMPEIWLDD